MRVVLMSDVHGNLAALEAVAVSIPPNDRVIVAGDLCLDGPRPAETLDMLIELGWELIKGNTDRDLVELPEDMSDHKTAVTHWCKLVLGMERVEVLDRLPFSLTVEQHAAILARVVHANPLNMDEHLPPTMDERTLRPYLAEAGAPLLAFGHLHTPYVRPVQGVLLVDVSSVGHPKDRDLRAAYTVVEWEGERRSVTQVRVPYDVERTAHDYRSCGMPDSEKHLAALMRASY